MSPVELHFDDAVGFAGSGYSRWRDDSELVGGDVERGGDEAVEVDAHAGFGTLIGIISES